MRKAIGIAVIKNGSILLVKKQETWILPGGKSEIDETDTECILREISEELPFLVVQNLIFFGTFNGITPHSKKNRDAKVYFADVEGDITPSAEISEAKWIKNTERYNLSDITQKIVLSLRQNGHL